MNHLIKSLLVTIAIFGTIGLIVFVFTKFPLSSFVFIVAVIFFTIWGMFYDIVDKD